MWFILLYRLQKFNLIYLNICCCLIKINSKNDPYMQVRMEYGVIYARGIFVFSAFS
jgi:hypothetical protein